VSEDHDHAFDLPPPAIMDHIATIPACIRARCCFETRVIAELCHQSLGIGNKPTIGNEWEITQRKTPATLVPLLFKCRAIFRLWLVWPDTMMKPLFTKCRFGTFVPRRDRWRPAMGHGMGRR
jgi:hypothetical protein